jgi:hypothetical protein
MRMVLSHFASGVAAILYEILNSVNVVMCDDYPAVLKDLTLVEECVIARRHPVGSILKLRPGNRGVRPTTMHRMDI